MYLSILLSICSISLNSLSFKRKKLEKQFKNINLNTLIVHFELRNAAIPRTATFPIAFVCLSYCPSVYLSVCSSTYQSISVWICHYLSVCPFVRLYTCLFLHLSICQTVYLTINPSVLLTMCTSLDVPFYLVVYLSIFLLKCLPICLTVQL